MIVAIWVVIGFVALAGVAYWTSYNRLVNGRNKVATSWATVDAELQRRHDLVPNLVEAVAAYAAHERDLLVRAAEANAKAIAAEHTPAAASQVEPAVATAAAELVALREGYPQLNSQQSFLELQHRLTITEDRIAAARRYYNTVVRNYNTRCQAFPSAIVARRGGFTVADLFDDGALC